MTPQRDIDAQWAAMKQTLLNDRGYEGAEEYLAFALEVIRRERAVAEARLAADRGNVVAFAP